MPTLSPPRPSAPRQPAGRLDQQAADQLARHAAGAAECAQARAVGNLLHLRISGGASGGNARTIRLMRPAAIALRAELDAAITEIEAEEARIDAEWARAAAEACLVADLPPTVLAESPSIIAGGQGRSGSEVAAAAFVAVGLLGLGALALAGVCAIALMGGVA